MGDFFTNLYEKFLLRDLLSFITPGGIIVISVLLLWQSPSELLTNLGKIHWILYIPFFGFVFIVGYAVQCLGAKIPPFWLGLPPLIKLHKWLSGKDSCDDDTLRQFYRERKRPFQRRAENDKVIDQFHERLVVLKQMAGNGALALLIATVILTFKYFFQECSILPITITIGLAVVLLLSLYCGHRHSVREESVLEEAVLEEEKE